MDSLFSDRDHIWMQQALIQAEQALIAGEVPIGAVLVHRDTVIAHAHNQPIRMRDPTAHAEIMALRKGAQVLGNYRLLDCTLYVTLEPCCMCASAMAHARIVRLVYGAYDKRAGVAHSHLQLFDQVFLNHRITHAGGLYAETCGRLLQDFFKTKRS